VPDSVSDYMLACFALTPEGLPLAPHSHCRPPGPKHANSHAFHYAESWADSEAGGAHVQESVTSMTKGQGLVYPSPFPCIRMDTGFFYRRALEEGFYRRAPPDLK
jgi:hypothetical protein